MTNETQKITVRPDGPYIVQGGIPLVRKSKVMSEDGEPLDWQKESELSTEDVYRLCRCGQSSNKPFCDGTHTKVQFDGIESADTGPIAERTAAYEGEQIVVKDDRSLCDHSGFCGNRFTNVWKMVKKSDAPQECWAQIIAMIEKCPSGALSYATDTDGENVEQDLTREITVVADGPLWDHRWHIGGAV